MKYFVAGLCAFTMSAQVPATELVKTPDGGYPEKYTEEASIYRGNIVFEHYCVLCHGLRADGKGRAAKLYDPKPANLVLSDKNDGYKEIIIRRGGAALMRSQFMPPWDDELTDEQITDVIAFLRSIQQKKF